MNRTLAISVIFLLVLITVACDSQGKSQIGISVPERLRQITVSAEGTLSAFINCDSVRRAMTIVDNTARGSCTNLSTTILHNVGVEFEFTLPNSGGSFLIASATKTGVSATSEGTDVAFSSNDFDTSMDNDGDGVSNLDEIEAGNNPGNPSCVFGTSLIGRCVL